MEFISAVYNTIGSMYFQNLFHNKGGKKIPSYFSRLRKNLPLYLESREPLNIPRHNKQDGPLINVCQVYLTFTFDY